MPDLEKKTARKWCKHLPIFDSALEGYQPIGLKTPVEAQSVAGDVAQDLLEQSLNHAARFFEETFDVRVDRYPAVVGGEESFGLAGQVRAHLELRDRPVPLLLNLDVASLCRLEGGAVGLTYYDVIAICWDDPRKNYNEDFERWARREVDDIGFVVAHEFMHHVQHVLANEGEPGWLRTSGRSVLGPAWLVEGTAVYVGMSYWLSRKSNYRRSTIREQRQDIKDTKLRLPKLHVTGTVRSNESYSVSAFAVDLLVRRHGEEVLFDYWREIGRGLSWEMAFK